MEIVKKNPNDSMMKNLELDEKRWEKSNEFLLLVLKDALSVWIEKTYLF